MKKEFLTPEQIQPKIKMHPNYIRALKYGKQYHVRNNVIETGYHFVINAVKKLYATLIPDAERTIFEMDRKALVNSVVGLHDFITPHFYFVLECDHMDKYWVYYAFSDCPFKKQIEQLFRRYSVTNYLKGQTFKQPFQEYFQNVLACQPREFIKILNPGDY